MAITTPSMALKRWDQPNDTFSYTELSDNFGLIDTHDHTTGKGVQIPTNGIANLAITETKIANNAVSSSKFANASITDAKLASPNAGAWKTLWTTGHRSNSADAAATTYIASNSVGFVSGTSTSSILLPVYPFVPTNYAVTGKTLQLKLTVNGMINGTAPAFTITFSLRPITIGGGAGVITYTAGAAVAGSDVQFIAPAANSAPINSATFNAPTSGTYGVGVTVSAGPAANSNCMWQMLVQYAHV